MAREDHAVDRVNHAVAGQDVGLHDACHAAALIGDAQLGQQVDEGVIGRCEHGERAGAGEGCGQIFCHDRLDQDRESRIRLGGLNDRDSLVFAAATSCDKLEG